MCYVGHTVKFYEDDVHIVTSLVLKRVRQCSMLFTC